MTSGMAPTRSANWASQSCEWSPVSIDTNTVTPRPSLSWSTSATRFWITPSASRRWIRFQHGVEDRPTRLPISATESEALSCRSARILRSIESISAVSIREYFITKQDYIEGFSQLWLWALYMGKTILFQALIGSPGKPPLRAGSGYLKSRQ